MVTFGRRTPLPEVEGKFDTNENRLAKCNQNRFSYRACIGGRVCLVGRRPPLPEYLEKIGKNKNRLSK